MLAVWPGSGSVSSLTLYAAFDGDMKNFGELWRKQQRKRY
jgi:hypothetical protein